MADSRKGPLQFAEEATMAFNTQAEEAQRELQKQADIATEEMKKQISPLWDQPQKKNTLKAGELLLDGSLKAPAQIQEITAQVPIINIHFEDMSRKDLDSIK